VRSVDLVADPAATAGLFESQQPAQEENLCEEIRSLCGLLRQFLQTDSITESKPVCKEQTVIEESIDTKTFVQCLKR